jgi:hypothetical protein
MQESFFCRCQLRMLHEHDNELTNTQIIHVSADHETWHCIHVFLNVFYTALKKRRPDHHRSGTGYGGNQSNLFESAHILCTSAAPLDKKKLQTSMRKARQVGSLHSNDITWMELLF